MSYLTDEQWAEVEHYGKERFQGKGSDEQQQASVWARELLRLRAEVEEIKPFKRNARLGASFRKLVERAGLGLYVTDYMVEDYREWWLYVSDDNVDELIGDEAAKDDT